MFRDWHGDRYVLKLEDMISRVNAVPAAGCPQLGEMAFRAVIVLYALIEQ